MIRIGISVLTLAVLVFFHNAIISLGLNVGTSFTFSKILPYMFQFFAFCLIIYQVYSQYLMNSCLTISRLVSTLFLFGASVIAFAVYHIYEGDFNDDLRALFVAGEAAD